MLCCMLRNVIGSAAVVEAAYVKFSDGHRSAVPSRDGYFISLKEFALDQTYLRIVNTMFLTYWV